MSDEANAQANEAEGQEAAGTEDQDTQKSDASAVQQEASQESSQEEFNWRDHVGEKWKSEAERFDTLDSVFEARDNFRKMASERIKLPGEDADEEELSKFRKALGVPDAADGYELKLPEGMELSEADQAFIDVLKPIAFENNIPVEAFTAFAVKFKELESQVVGERDSEIVRHREEKVGELRKEWGPDYDTNVNIANRAMTTVAGDDFVEFANTTELKDGGVLANDPRMVKMFAKIGRQMSEDGTIFPMDSNEAKSLAEKASDLTAKKMAALASGDKREAERLDREAAAIYERMSGDTPIVGSMGRGV